MKGDFSRWETEGEENLQGVLHQQGRVLLDSDWNDQTRLNLEWQEGAARDVIGPGVAAVPAHTPDAFKVSEARVVGSDVELKILPGGAWVNGLAMDLPGAPPDLTAAVTRLTTYLQPPIQDPADDVGDIGAGVRDAVILEVWRSALNGFQTPETLIEPALGGPDTTERVQYALRFRLFRMGEDDTCRNILGRLQDDFSQKGKLKVTLLPTTSTGGDCPVEEGSGYIGFEHHLYRIEMAQVDSAQPMFKWSQFNGGLVGRGECDLGGPDKKITVTANDQAIKTSGLNSFYLEVVQYDQDQGYWRVTYGADVTLDGDELVVGTERYTKVSRPSGRTFFRLWNGIEEISGYLKVPAGSDPTELRDGIRLEFDADTGDNYQPGDYWTFKVRAGGLGNLDPLIDDQPPQGVHYQRVPLAILNWEIDQDISFDDDEIDDCRDIFRPLTRQKVCCSFTVGDGISTFGDFNSIEEALRHLPDSSGEICLLPGLHYAKVVIEGRKNIKIRGCDKRTTVMPPESDPAAPIFEIKDSKEIVLEHMDLATFDGSAIVLEGSELGELASVVIRHNRIAAYEHAIHARQVWDVRIHHNVIRMWDREGGDVAIFFQGEGGLIKRNDIAVVPAGTQPPLEDVPEDGEIPDPSDDCLEPEEVYLVIQLSLILVQAIFEMMNVQFEPVDPYKALGGIQIGSGSERVRIVENAVQGGAGNGITLGSDVDPDDMQGLIDGADDVEPVMVKIEVKILWGEVRTAEGPLSDTGIVFEHESGFVSTSLTDENGFFTSQELAPVEYTVSLADPDYRIVSVQIEDSGEFGLYYIFEAEKVDPEVTLGSLLDFIYEVRIEGNEIAAMSLSGIGVPMVSLPDLTAIDGAEQVVRTTPQLLMMLLLVRIFGFLGGFVVDLRIDGNRIHGCLQRTPDPQLEAVLRGEGGVSLGLCEDLRIRDNRIENNGTDRHNPVTGVFVLLADQMELSRNHILGNGPLIDDQGQKTGAGIWGGAFIMFASGLSLGSRLLSDGEITGGGEFAARISGNVIDQPVSRALTMLAFGPLSIVDNTFHTASTFTEGLDRLVGGVLIANAGGFHRLSDVQLRGRLTQVRPARTAEDIGRASGGGNPGPMREAIHFVEFPDEEEGGPQAELGQLESPQENLPDGNVLFNDNRMLLGSGTSSAIGQLIVTADDLGFDGNQCDTYSTLEALSVAAMAANLQQVNIISLINTVLVGFSSRATDSRFKEMLIEQFGLRALSLLSVSFTLNNTSNNQGNHCILSASLLEAAYPGYNLRVSTGNQSLFYPTEACETIEEAIKEHPRLLVVLLARLMLGRG